MYGLWYYTYGTKGIPILINGENLLQKLTHPSSKSNKNQVKLM